MEFRFRAGETRDQSSSPIDTFFDSSSNSYFTQQALLAGISIGSSNIASANMPKEALLEAIRKERMRAEEVLAREIERKKMLEEEILRELENERRFSIDRFEGEDIRFGERLERGFERSPFDRREIRNDERVVECFGNLDELKTAEVGKAGFPKVLSKEAMSRSMDNKFLANKLSGVKRKAARELPLLAKKVWSCSLCHVTATSEKSLNVHIRGKKHKLKEAQLTSKKPTTPSKKLFTPSHDKESNKPLSKDKVISSNEPANKTTSEKSNEKDGNKLFNKEKGNPFDEPANKTASEESTEKDGNKPLSKEKGISVNEPTNKRRTEGNNWRSNKKQSNVWCGVCKVKCNSPATLECHLNGKKHKAQLEAKKSEITEVVIKEVTDQEEKSEDVTQGEDNIEADEAAALSKKKVAFYTELCLHFGKSVN